MSLLKLSVTLFTVLVVCSVDNLPTASAQSPFPNGERLEFDYGGSTISVPYFDPTIESVTPDRKAFELNTLTEFQGQTNETLWAAFHEGKRFGLIKYMSKSTGALFAARCAYLALPEASRQPPMTPRFTNRLYDMWMDTIKKADEMYLKERATRNRAGQRKASEAEVVQFIDDVNKFSAMMAEVVSRSPTGLYMDWKKMTIDGVPATDKAKYLIVFARENGFQFPVYLAGKLANTLKNFDWNSEKSPTMLALPMKALFAFHRCPKIPKQQAQQQAQLA